MALSLSGFSVLVARDGLSALQVLEHDHPDAAILDLMLPCLDGWAVLQEFQTRADVRDIPVVVVTSCAELGPAAEQAHAVLRKPCDPSEVVATVQRHLPAARFIPS